MNHSPTPWTFKCGDDWNWEEEDRIEDAYGEIVMSFGLFENCGRVPSEEDIIFLLQVVNEVK